MKFLKDMMGRKSEDRSEEIEGTSLSIEELQRDLDSSGINNSLRNPESAWSEKAAQVADDLEEVSEPTPDTGAFDDTDEIEDEEMPERELSWDELEDEVAPRPRSRAYDARRARRQTRPIADEDFDVGDEDDGAELDEFDDEFDEFDEYDPEEEKAIQDNAILVDEIRDAIAAVRHIETDAPAKGRTADTSAQNDKGGWEQDDVFGRKALARDQLARLAESGDDDRILEETRLKMDDDDEASRRRLAMAHLKAAAAATKADSVLKRVVGRDPATDLEQQVQYREDLANVVRQRGPRSETISRPLSRPLSRPVTRPVSEQVKPHIKQEDAAAASEPHNDFGEAAEREEPMMEASVAKPMPSPDPQPMEPAMDAEKLDLKTALERQKAILKAEREALEAEMAGDDVTADEDSADAAFRDAEAEEVTASTEMEEADDAQFDDTFDAEETEDIFEATDENEASDEGEDDDWDAGVEPVSATDETDVVQDQPVDLTSLQSEREPEAEEQEIDIEEVDEAPEVAPAVPAPRRAGRVKTRLLGFQSKTPGQDVFDGKMSTGAGPVRYPVGWLVVTKGEGFGHSFSLLSGVSKIGRGEDQAVTLDFGDTSISRDNHAAIAFDEELNQFFLGHGGKSNVVRLNGKPVLSTEELFDGDEIRIGETTLKFIALCSEEFTWAQSSGDDTEHAASA